MFHFKSTTAITSHMLAMERNVWSIPPPGFGGLVPHERSERFGASSENPWCAFMVLVARMGLHSEVLV